MLENISKHWVVAVAPLGVVLIFALAERSPLLKYIFIWIFVALLTNTILELRDYVYATWESVPSWVKRLFGKNGRADGQVNSTTSKVTASYLKGLRDVRVLTQTLVTALYRRAVNFYELISTSLRDQGGK